MGYSVQETNMRVTPPKPRSVLAAFVPRPEREPVFVEKAGLLDPVILSAEQY